MYAPLSLSMKETLFAEHTLNNRKKIIFSIVLIFALLAVGLSSYFIIEAIAEEGAAVTVALDGDVVAEYSLKIDGEYKLNGGTNILVIEGGYAYMKSADCPKQHCVNYGKINRTNERIICAHNNITVSVVRAGEEIFPN